MGKNNNSKSWCDLIEPYEGQWVALNREKTEVVGHSKSRKTALKQAKSNGVKIAFIVKSPFEWI